MHPEQGFPTRDCQPLLGSGRARARSPPRGPVPGLGALVGALATIGLASRSLKRRTPNVWEWTSLQLEPQVSTSVSSPTRISRTQLNPLETVTADIQDFWSPTDRLGPRYRVLRIKRLGVRVPSSARDDQRFPTGDAGLFLCSRPCVIRNVATSVRTANRHRPPHLRHS